MDPLIETILNSSKQLTEDVRALTKVVHELTISTKVNTEMQQANALRTEGRLDGIEEWRSDVDKHINSMGPVKDIAVGVRKVITGIIVGAIVGIIGYSIANTNGAVTHLVNKPEIQKEE